MTATSKPKRTIHWALYVMLIPGIIITLIYSYGPLVGLSIAFQKFDFTKGLFGSAWVGFDNFKYIFSLPDFKRSLSNTLFIAITKMIIGLFFPIVVAILLNEIRQTGYKRTLQTMIYLPFFISWVIVSGIMLDMMSPSTGMLNSIVKAFGFRPIFFLGNNNTFPWVLIITDIWKNFGFGTILYMAALTGIDPSLYEAANIDGANRFHRMLYITLPGIVPIIVLNGTLSLGGVLNAGFDQVVNMYSPVVYKSGDIIDTLVYRVGIQGVVGSVPQYAIAAAMGLFKSVISFFMVSSAYLMAYKFADYRIF